MTDLSLPITSITALVNGLILMLLTVRVIMMRRRDGVVLGDNNDRAMIKAIRGQANAAEQIPMALILLALIELQGGQFWILALLAVSLTAGRLMHGIYFGINGTPWQLRFYGMFLTLMAQGGSLLTLLVIILV